MAVLSIILIGLPLFAFVVVPVIVVHELARQNPADPEMW